MKQLKSSLCAIAVFVLFTTACTEKHDDIDLILTGSLISKTECKTNKSTSISNNESCIKYSFNKEKNTLVLNHINAAFNCCPDSFYCIFAESGDTIIIEEYEKEAGCRCNCLYDLTFEIKGVNASNYIIKMVEPYVSDEKKLVFQIDLLTNENGNFCVTRSKYPWFESETIPLELSGELLNHSSCKNNKSQELEISTSDSTSCITYTFNESNNELLLTHINAGFNCCPESIYSNISLKADTILIEEIESGGLCNCNCLYDLNYSLVGVEAKKYVIRIIEPHLSNQDELIFNVDLAIDKECSHCVTRNQYPWGL